MVFGQMEQREGIEMKRDFVNTGAEKLYEKIKNKSEKKFFDNDCINIFEEIEEKKKVKLTKEQEREIIKGALIRAKEKGGTDFTIKLLNELVWGDMAEDIVNELVKDDTTSELYGLVSEKIEDDKEGLVKRDDHDDIVEFVKKKFIGRFIKEKKLEEKLNGFGIYFETGELAKKLENENKKNEEKKKHNAKIEKEIEEIFVSAGYIKNMDKHIQNKIFEERDEKIRVSDIRKIRILLEKRRDKINRRKKGRRL